MEISRVCSGTPIWLVTSSEMGALGNGGPKPPSEPLKLTGPPWAREQSARVRSSGICFTRGPPLFKYVTNNQGVKWDRRRRKIKMKSKQQTKSKSKRRRT